ncbi:MAG: hypothetical protein ACI9N9_001959 [Enterobacterales bacterium]|jgi:uncharacterized protein (DUF302 family)
MIANIVNYNSFYEGILMRELRRKIKTNFYNKACFIVLLFFCFSLSTQAQAEVLKKLGEAYVIHLPGSTSFDDVVKHLENETFGANWQVVSQMDVGAAVDELGVTIESRVLSVCKIKYLAQAIKEDPLISLIIPCRFTVFRDPIGEEGDSRIVVGFYDPLAEAEALDIKQVQAAKIASQELKEILLKVAEFH